MREIETVMRIGRKIPVRIPLWRRFDLDNASTEVSQQRRSVRTSNKGRALKNRNVLQGLDRHETFLQTWRGSEVTARDQPFCADRYRSLKITADVFRGWFDYTSHPLTEMSTPLPSGS